MSAPLPEPAITPDPELEGFWEATTRGGLLLARCDRCDHVIWYPRPFCPACGSDEVTWFEASGSGTIYTYTVARRSSGAFAEAAPYVIAHVELEEGPRVLTNIVDCDPDAVQIGQRVSVTFGPAAAGAALWRFRPAETTEAAR